MKIAFLSREYPPDTAWGGLATLYHSLACALVQRGHEVHVICQALDKPAESVEDGVIVHRVGTNPKRYTAMSRINYMFHAWLKLRDIIKRHGIEVVEANYWGAEAFLYTFEKRVPLVIRGDLAARDMLLTKNYSGMKEKTALKALSLLEDYSLRKADRVIAISRNMYTGIINRLHIPKEKVDIVLHGIDTSRYHFVESDIRKRLEIPERFPLVLFVGRLERRKGVLVLCQAIPEVIRSMPMARFVFVGRDTKSAPGGGSVRSYISQIADHYGYAGNLHFIEFLPPDELIAMYSACDVFVLPSVQEGCGLVTLEALSCGKPVVATNTGVVLDLGLEPPCLEIVSPANAVRMAESIIRMLLLNNDQRRLAAKKGRELIETRFSTSKWVDNVLLVYEKALIKK